MKLFTKKLPTLIGIIILLSGLAAGVYLASNPQLLKPKAGPEGIIPKNIRITNIGIDTFTVSFTTDLPTASYLLAGAESQLSINTSNYFLDNRDRLSGSIMSYTDHYITVVNGQSQEGAKFVLENNKNYYFKIGLGDLSGTKNLFDNSGVSYEVKTAITVNNKPADIISGSVKDSSGDGLDGVLVYLSMPGATPLSALTNNGRFLIPINMAYTLDLTQPASYETTSTKIEIFTQKESLNSTILSNTGIKNLPDLTLGENYDLTSTSTLESSSISADASNVIVGQNDYAPTATPTQPTVNPTATPTQGSTTSPTPTPGSDLNEIGSGFSTLSDLNSTDNDNLSDTEEIELDITYPTYEGEEINSAKPEFRGTGPASILLSITINPMANINTRVSVDTDGEWTFSPSSNLAEGDYTITVSYVRDSGDEEAVSKDFTIKTSRDDLPSFTSTPSATISPSSSPTPTKIIRADMPSTESGVPMTGVSYPTIILIAAGIFFLMSGIKFMYKR